MTFYIPNKQLRKIGKRKKMLKINGIKFIKKKNIVNQLKNNL